MDKINSIFQPTGPHLMTNHFYNGFANVKHPRHLSYCLPPFLIWFPIIFVRRNNHITEKKPYSVHLNVRISLGRPFFDIFVDLHAIYTFSYSYFILVFERSIKVSFCRTVRITKSALLVLIPIITTYYESNY